MKTVLSAIALLSVLTVAAEAKPSRSGGADAGAADMITRYRAAHGLGPVRVDPALTRAARQQAQAMAAAGVLSHDVAGSLGSRLRAVGYSPMAAAENVGAGHRSLQEAMAGWERSSGHRANLLMSSATRIGIARVDAPGKPYGIYWALVLAGENAADRTASTATGGAPFSFGSAFRP